MAIWKLDPWEVVWWRDEDGNYRQVTRASAPEDWTEITKGFPVEVAEDDTAAQSADSNKVEE